MTLNEFDARYICREYILENKCLFLKQDNYHCCKTCYRKVEAGLMPSVAAKNNLQCPWDTVPRELLKLNEVILCFLLFPILHLTKILGGECCFGPGHYLCQHS